MRKLLLPLFFGFFLGLLLPAISEANFCSPGDKAMVQWHGSNYPATVLSAKGGNKCFIHYDGYGSNWDEWVGPGRIQITSSLSGAAPGSVLVGGPGFQVGNPVQVLWGGKWWPAHVLQMRGNELYIHYNGYGNKWNEWVGPSRYR